MDATSGGLAAVAAPWAVKIRAMGALPLLPHCHVFVLGRRKSRAGGGGLPGRIICCRGDSPEFPKLGKRKAAASAVEKGEEWGLESRKSPRKVRMQALPSPPFSSPR